MADTRQYELGGHYSAFAATGQHHTQRSPGPTAAEHGNTEMSQRDSRKGADSGSAQNVRPAAPSGAGDLHRLTLSKDG